jgi:hypothetical protein
MGYIGSGPTRFNTADDLTVTGDAEFNGNLTVKGTTTTIDSASVQTIDLGDNDKIRLGDSDDLQIYHNGTHSYIDDTGAGSLYLRGDNYVIIGSTTGEEYITGNANGAVRLKYDNSTKLTTTSTGVDVTGTVTAEASGVNNSYITATGTGGSANLNLKGADDGFSSVFFRDTTGIRGRLQYDHTNETLRMDTNAIQRFLIDSDGDISFYEDTGTSPKFFWDASAESLGIGTTSPGGELHLYRNSTGPCRLLLQNTEDLSYIYSDGGQLIFDSDNGHLFRNENGTTEFGRFDSSGNLLVGKTTNNDTDAGVVLREAGEILVTRAGDVATFNRLTSDGNIVRFRKDGTTVGSIALDTTPTATAGTYFKSDADNAIIHASGSNGAGLHFNTANSISPVKNAIRSDGTTNLGSSSNRFKDIYLSGNVYLGGSSESDVGIDIKQANLTSLITLNGRMNNSGTTTTAIQFKDGSGGSNVGSITVNSSGTTYNTTSDIRLKTDIEPINHATDMLMAMNPVSHRWKADPDADAVVGFIAQEMQEIVPEAVSGSADSDEMMSMDYGRITPVLVAALQDAHNKIEQLEQRLANMENK